MEVNGENKNIQPKHNKVGEALQWWKNKTKCVELNDLLAIDYLFQKNWHKNMNKNLIKLESNIWSPAENKDLLKLIIRKSTFEVHIS